jgi:hypothetical protein
MRLTVFAVFQETGDVVLIKFFGETDDLVLIS